jgi:hypothetical protein
VCKVRWLKDVQQKHATSLTQRLGQWGVVADAQVPFEPYDVYFPAALLHGCGTMEKIGLFSTHHAYISR